MIRSCDAWGPFRPDLDPVERAASLRCLRAVVHMSTGARGADAVTLLHRAEHDTDLLEPALAALGRLDPLDKRRIWASYAALHRPAA